MSANLQPQTLNTWLKGASNELRLAGITSADLDAEVILAHTLKKGRTYLHAHPDDLLDMRSQDIADARLGLRLDRVPVAYIVGHKEFYGRRFIVTTATLIPRPESETIIDVVKELLPHNQSLLAEKKRRLIDIGTGSGCIGITLQLEAPELDVTLADVSTQALTIAEKNATQLKTAVHILKSDLLKSYAFDPDIIVANLPYVNPEWERSPETNHEPELALFADDNGEALIKKLIIQASNRLTPGGYLVLEADPSQHHDINTFAKQYGFEVVKHVDYIIALQLSVR